MDTKCKHYLLETVYVKLSYLMSMSGTQPTGNNAEKHKQKSILVDEKQTLKQRLHCSFDA